MELSIDRVKLTTPTRLSLKVYIEVCRLAVAFKAFSKVRSHRLYIEFHALNGMVLISELFTWRAQYRLIVIMARAKSYVHVNYNLIEAIDPKRHREIVGWMDGGKRQSPLRNLTRDSYETQDWSPEGTYCSVSKRIAIHGVLRCLFVATLYVPTYFIGSSERVKAHSRIKPVLWILLPREGKYLRACNVIILLLSLTAACPGGFSWDARTLRICGKGQRCGSSRFSEKETEIVRTKRYRITISSGGTGGNAINWD